jgi:hypothetical protein
VLALFLPFSAILWEGHSQDLSVNDLLEISPSLSPAVSRDLLHNTAQVSAPCSMSPRV